MRIMCIVCIVSMILFLPIVFAANYVGTPTTCPSSDATNFPGQNCTPLDICGSSSGIAQCYDTSTISAPVVDLNSTTDYSGSFNGGYLTDCYATVDASAPFCDNSGAFWCDRNSSCQNVGRITTCAANKFQADATPSFCSSCRSGFTECDGSFTDADGCEVESGVTNCAVGSNNNINSSCTCVCDSTWNDCDASGAGAGNGCEIQTGAVCTVGSLSGTYSGCTCVIPKQTFETGTNAQYNEDTNSLLWGTNYGDGNLAWLFNADANLSFRVDANSNVFSDNNVTAKWLKSFDLNVGNVGISNNSTFWRFSDLNSNSITACGSDANSVQNSRGLCVSLSNFHLQGSGTGSTEHYTAGGNLVLDTADNNKFHFNDANFLAATHTWSGTQLFNGLTLFGGATIATADQNNFTGKINAYDVNVGKTGISNNSTFFAFLDMNRSAVSAGCGATQFLGGDGACHTPAGGAGGVTGLVAGWGMDTNSYSGDVNLSIDEAELTARNHTWSGTHTFGNTLNLNDNILFNFSTGLDASIEWTTTGNDNLQIGTDVGNTNHAGYISIVEQPDIGNANRSPTTLTANPTLRVYSADETQADDFVDLSHNQTNPIIDFGNGSYLDINGSERLLDGFIEPQADGLSYLEKGFEINTGQTNDTNSHFSVESEHDKNALYVGPETGWRISTNYAFDVNGTSGLTQVLSVRDSGGAGDCTITVTGGIITASTC